MISTSQHKVGIKKGKNITSLSILRSRNVKSIHFVEIISYYSIKFKIIINPKFDENNWHRFWNKGRNDKVSIKKNIEQ
jgi:hypothetical protein